MTISKICMGDRVVFEAWDVESRPHRMVGRFDSPQAAKDFCSSYRRG